MPTTLVIDNDPDFEKLCLETLDHDQDHNFLFAHSDEEALSILGNGCDPDIAMVSIDGGPFSGMDLFRNLTGRKVRVPRIALTGTADLGSIRKAMNGGAADFLTKPVQSTDLRATIEKVFQDTERRRNAWKAEAQLSALRRELDLAEDIQKQILPSCAPRHDQLDISARLTPARKMSGDFYDFFDIGPDQLGLAVADVSGKGVPAAFFMAVARTLLRSTALHGYSPAECLEIVNRHLCELDVPSMFVSVFYCILNTRTWELCYANGGHLPPYLINEQTAEIEPLEDGAGTILGFDHGLPYKESSFVMQPGSTLFFYTDGVTEAFDKDRNQLSEQRLMDYLLENRSLSAHGIAENVFAFVNMFADGAEQSDDITSLAIKRFTD